MQMFGQRRDFAEDQQRRRLHRVFARAFGQFGQGADDYALVRSRAVFDQRERRVGGTSVRDQALAQCVESGHAHVDSERLPFGRE